MNNSITKINRIRNKKELRGQSGTIKEIQETRQLYD